MLLARMAEAVYWAGRYLEGAPKRQPLRRCRRRPRRHTHGRLPIGADVGWEPLVHDIFAPDHARGGYESGVGDGDHPWGTPAPDFSEERVVRLVLSDLGNPSSVLASLDMARRNLLHGPRPVVPRGVGDHPQPLERGSRRRRHRRRSGTTACNGCRRVVGECQRITGSVVGIDAP